MKDKQESRHHLYPRSRWWTWESDNIILIDVKTHQAFHTCFDNDTPVEQLQRLLYFNRTALQQEYYERVMKAIGEDDKYIYKDWVLRPK